MAQYTRQCVGCTTLLSAGDRVMMTLDGGGPAHFKWDLNGEADPCRKAVKEERAHIMEQEVEAESAGDGEGSLA